MMNRLRKYEKNNIFMSSLSYCMNCIEKTNDEIWEENLKDMVNNIFHYELDEKGNLISPITYN